jgi:hypothetical protein
MAEQQIEQIFARSVPSFSDENLYKTSSTMGWSLPMGQDYMFDLFRGYQQNDRLNVNQAIDLISNYQLYKVYEAVLPVVVPIIEAEENIRYLVDTDVLIKTPNGAIISSVIVRKRGDSQNDPALFNLLFMPMRNGKLSRLYMLLHTVI